MALQKLAAIAGAPASHLRWTVTAWSRPGDGGLQSQPPIVPAGLHVPRAGLAALHELRVRSDRDDRRAGRGRSAPCPPSSSRLDAFGYTRRLATAPPRSGSSGTTAARPWRSRRKSRLGDEPGFDETAPPGQGNSKTTTPPPPKPAGPGGPALQGPTASRIPRNGQVDTALADRGSTATAAQRVRRASLSERLKPFLDESSANELIYPNKADRPWRYIVCITVPLASGNYDQIDGEHRKILGFDGCGYHFVIGNGTGSGDGQIEVAQRWTNQKQGVHCRNARTHDVDEYGIGICLVGDLDKQPPTPRQIAAAKALIAYLSQRYNIAPSRVETHAHLAATKTVCPGKYFPNEAILDRDQETRQADGQCAPAWKVVRDTSAN